MPDLKIIKQREGNTKRKQQFDFSIQTCIREVLERREDGAKLLRVAFCRLRQFRRHLAQLDVADQSL